MAKKYFYTLLLLASLASTETFFAQEKQSLKAQETTIEGLSIYPNPVSGDRITIVTKLNEDKEITIFDILGKKVLQTEMSSSRELNIGSLTPGVYIIQIREAEATATRKLIIK